MDFYYYGLVFVMFLFLLLFTKTFGFNRYCRLNVLVDMFVLICLFVSKQPMEVYVDDEAKLTLHGLQQHYVKLKENEKNKKLFELLDVLEFNQVNIGFLDCDT